MNVDEYLKRINCEGLKDVSLENLTKLQKNHIIAIPFENLDLIMGKHINLNIQEAYDKVMKQPRGGYCLELNPLFGWLLTELGYKFYYVASYVYVDKRFMKFKTHIILIVKLNGKEYYVEATPTRNEPIELVHNKPTKLSFGVYQFVKDHVDPEYFILEQSPKKCFLNGSPEWTPQIKFKLIPKELESFKEANELAQSKEYSTLISKNICTRHTKNSLLILVGWKYSEILFQENEEIRTDLILENEEQVRKILLEKFDIIVDETFKPKDEPIPSTAF